jgi:hypothetical protein
MRINKLNSGLFLFLGSANKLVCLVQSKTCVFWLKSEDFRSARSHDEAA